MKKTAELSVLVVAVLLAVAVIAKTQQAKKVPRSGYLSSTDATREPTRAEAIRPALRERG